MKKGIVIGTLAGAAILGFGVYQSSASEAIQHNPKLSHDDVKETIAIEYPGNITEFELDTEDGRVIYEIEIKGEDVKYDLDVDADTGEVIEVEQKQYKQNKKNNDKVTETENKLEDIISVEEAEAIAQKEFSGTVIGLELDKDDGRYVYEIELRNGNQEADMEIDTKTGEILELELEYEDD